MMNELSKVNFFNIFNQRSFSIILLWILVTDLLWTDFLMQKGIKRVSKNWIATNLWCLSTDYISRVVFHDFLSLWTKSFCFQACIATVNIWHYITAKLALPFGFPISWTEIILTSNLLEIPSEGSFATYKTASFLRKICPVVFSAP